jgi:hypothetical protein
MAEYHKPGMTVRVPHGPFYNTGHELILPPWGLGRGPPRKARVSVFRGYPQATTMKRGMPGNEAKEKETFSS